MFIGSKPKDLFPRQNKAAADFYRRQQQKRIQAQGPYLVQRSFRRNEGTTDYATIPTVTLAGDFVIEFDLLTSTQTQSTCLALYTSDASEYIYLQILSNGFLKVSSSGFTPGNGSTVVNNGVFNRIMVALIGDQFSVFVNGSLDYSVTHTNPSKLGSGYGAIIYAAKQSEAGSVFENLSGILANLKIYDNGTLIRDYPLDDNSDILRNRATVLGGELVGNGDFSDESDWSLGDGWSISGGAAYCDGSQAADTILSQAVSAPIGDYLIEIDTGNISAGDVKSIFFGGVKFNSSGITSAGKSRFVGTTINSDNLAIIGNSSFIGSVDNISIRQADGYGTVINGNASDWGLFQQQVTGEWLGQELWTDGIVGSLAPLTILSDSLGVYSEGLSYLYMNNVGLLNANDGTGFNQVSGSTFVRTSSGAIAVRNMSPSESALNFTPSVKEVLNVA